MWMMWSTTTIPRSVFFCFENARATLKESLLPKRSMTKAKMELTKMKYSLPLPFLITVLPYVIVEIPFIVTHKVPAVILFLPVLAMWACITAAAFRFTSPVTAQAWSAFDIVDDSLGRLLLTFVEQATRLGFINLLPVLFGLSVANEFLTFAPMYLYGGEGYWASVATFLTERNLGRYLDALKEKIFSYTWSFLGLLSEAT
uniref:Uncharacterized protein n=1 Tax=Alexandrium monilatum TaxID=311494 RepID=A0A7S4Q3Q5_9DINO